MWLSKVCVCVCVLLCCKFKDTFWVVFLLKKYICLFIYLTVRGLSCGMWDLVPGSEIESSSPALGAWSLSHWTTREVPWVVFLYCQKMFFNSYPHICLWFIIQIRSDQISRSVVSDSLWPHELQHARPNYTYPIPLICSSAKICQSSLSWMKVDL